jgi:hypothetical protein
MLSAFTMTEKQNLKAYSTRSIKTKELIHVHNCAVCTWKKLNLFVFQNNDARSVDSFNYFASLCPVSQVIKLFAKGFFINQT